MENSKQATPPDAYDFIVVGSGSGGFDSMANPTKSFGGRPDFQFIARRHIPSPRCSFSVNSALVFLPVTWKSLAAMSALRCEVRWGKRNQVGEIGSAKQTLRLGNAPK